MAQWADIGIWLWLAKEEGEGERTTTELADSATQSGGAVPEWWRMS